MNLPFTCDGTYAVWNSLSDQILELSREEYLALLQNRPEDITLARQLFLQEKGILASEPDEMGRFLERRYANRQLRSPYFRILTTTACNARCAYCYERGFPIRNMDNATADVVARFIADRYREHPLNSRVTLEWFGGEPSLNRDPIRQIIARLAEAGIPFQSHMTSNGILLTQSVLAEARAWNLRRIQITLDAADRAYDAIKGVPAGTYHRVLENIDCCLSAGIRVVLRLNYAGNRNQIGEIIDQMAARYSGKPEKPKLYIPPVYDGVKSIPADIMGEIMQLNEMLIRRNLIPVCGGGCSAAQYGIAGIHQCIPYKNVITDILRKHMQYSDHD